MLFNTFFSRNCIRLSFKSFFQIVVAFFCAHFLFHFVNHVIYGSNNCNSAITLPPETNDVKVEETRDLASYEGSPFDLDDEVEVKRGLELDAENDAANNVSEPDKIDAVVLIEDIEPQKTYDIDYSLAHPFENSCWFPVLRRDDEDLKSYVARYRSVDCRGHKHVFAPLVHQHRNGEILIGRPHRSLFKKSFFCEYKELSGTLAPYMNYPRLVGEWKQLPTGQRILIQKDQFVIQCKTGNDTVYHNAFAWISDKPRLTPPPALGPTKYGISILTIDSTSRNQFYRHMPFTLKFLREKNFQILYGYTKVGDNSAINWLPILSGMVYDHINRGFANITSADQHFNYKTNESLHSINGTIFDRARDYGWPTLWNDEIANPNYGLFHYYGWRGFRRPPADYYFRSYYTYIYKNLGASSGCSNGEPILPKWLSLWEQFTTKHKDHCHLSMNFYAGLTHGSANNLELYDIPVSDALQRMKTAGVLENTVLVIMGDHGQRISPIQKSHIGRIEERMSMMGIYMPPKFRHDYPEKYANLIKNRHRLTSNFDFHETLQDLLDLGSGHRRIQKQNHGISLFDAIPINRTCIDAMIPENFCVCLEKPQKNETKTVDKAKARIVSVIKEHIKNITQTTCITHYDLNVIQKTCKYGTISKMARGGVRFMNTDAKKADMAIRNVFEMECKAAINVITQQNKVFNGTIITRAQYNTNLDLITVNAEPLVSFEKCNVAKVVIDVCSC